MSLNRRALLRTICAVLVIAGFCVLPLVFHPKVAGAVFGCVIGGVLMWAIYQYFLTFESDQ